MTDEPLAADTDAPTREGRDKQWTATLEQLAKLDPQTVAGMLLIVARRAPHMHGDTVQVTETFIGDAATLFALHGRQQQSLIQAFDPKAPKSTSH